MEAGIEHLGRRTAEAVDLMIIVVEPGLKSLETATRIRKLAKEIGVDEVVAVINKVSNEDEEAFVTSKLNEIGLNVLGSIPHDYNVVRADMEGQSLVNYPDSSALKAVEDISENILSNLPQLS
jgi:CO dehydrogenase maturation factor